MSGPARCVGVAAAVALALAVPAGAQDRPPSFSVGRIESAGSCTLYQQAAGSSGVIVTRRAIAAYERWRTWLVRDCVDHFAGIRTALEAALASGGGVGVRGSGARYVVTGRISDVSGGGTAPDAPDRRPDGYSVATSGMRVVMDASVRDGAGRIVFGVPLVKTIRTGLAMKVGGFEMAESGGGQAAYAQLQQQVALAIARAVSFHFAPLRVTGGGGRTIALNYGAPLLALGTMVMVTPPDGGPALRYNVVSAADGSAQATLDGGGDPARAVAGSRASVVEADDPAANARRFEKVELP